MPPRKKAQKNSADPPAVKLTLESSYTQGEWTWRELTPEQERALMEHIVHWTDEVLPLFVADLLEPPKPAAPHPVHEPGTCILDGGDMLPGTDPPLCFYCLLDQLHYPYPHEPWAPITLGEDESRMVHFVHHMGELHQALCKERSPLSLKPLDPLRWKMDLGRTCQKCIPVLVASYLAYKEAHQHARTQ